MIQNIVIIIIIKKRVTFTRPGTENKQFFKDGLIRFLSFYNDVMIFRYEYRVEMIHQQGSDTSKNIVREFGEINL